MYRARIASLFLAIALGTGVAVTSQTARAGVPATSAFTYQGQLRSGLTLVDGMRDLKFRLYDASAGGVQVGPELLATGVQCVNGRFAVELDFGAIPFTGQARWLEVDVSAPGGGGPFSTMSPRQSMTATPYALYALNGPAGPAGPMGPAGPQGPAGNDGAPGVAGPQGPAGNDGAPGPAGPQGAPGAQGPQGPAGNDGAPGATGPQGPAGNDGAAGAPGPVGPQGAPGAQGPQGPAGNDGAAGAPGPVGPQGPAGNDGAPGAQGPQGPAGADGGVMVQTAGGQVVGTMVRYEFGGVSWVTRKHNGQALAVPVDSTGIVPMNYYAFFTDAACATAPFGYEVTPNPLFRLLQTVNPGDTTGYYAGDPLQLVTPGSVMILGQPGTCQSASAAGWANPLLVGPLQSVDLSGLLGPYSVK